MKTIAITIDKKTLECIDQLLAGDNTAWKSRSAVIRQAVKDFVSRLERVTEEERERLIFRRCRERLNRQAAVLVKEQAKL